MDKGEQSCHVRLYPFRAIGSCRSQFKTSQTAPPYLPGEITDTIISFLPEVDYDFRPGYQSLCSCALVCRNWLPASRHTLFAYVSIRNNDQYTLFVSSAVRSQSGRSWLSSTRRFALRGDSSDSPGSENSTRLFVHELGGQFPNLEGLSLNKVYFSSGISSPSPWKFASLSAFASVQVLKLFSCRFPSFAAARYTLISLPSLVYLSLQDTTWPTARGSEPPLPFLRGSRKSPFLGKIRCLNFFCGEATCDDKMLQWFSTTSLAVSLEDLNV